MARAQSGQDFFQHSRADKAEPVSGCNDVSCDPGFVCGVFEKGMTREKPLDSRQQVSAEVYALKVKEETISTVFSMQERNLDFVEICAPWDSPLSEEYEKQGGRVDRLGLHNGYDLSTRYGYRKAAAFLREHKPRNVHMAPACFPWSQFQNINQRTEKQVKDLQEKRRVGRKVLKHLESLAEIQIQELQGELSGEQPWTASSWQERSWHRHRISKMAGGSFRVDGCRFGMKHPKTGKLLKKSWGFFATKQEVKRSLHLTCHHPREAHSPIEGNVTPLTATYPRQLCKVFVKAMQSNDIEYKNLCQLAATLEQERILVNDEMIEHENHETDQEQEQQEHVNQDAVQDLLRQETETGEMETGQDQIRMRKLLVIHKNLGHPSVETMCKLLRQAGVHKRYLVLAKSLECDVCKKQLQRKPKLPASPTMVTEKWHTISVDTFWWSNPVRKNDDPQKYVVGISYFDEATDLHVAAVDREGVTMPGNISVSEFSNHFSHDWLKCLPKPQVVRCDVEGCFRGKEILRWFEGQAIRVEHIAGEAPWQLGKHSRHLHTLKQQMSKLADELGPEVGNREIVALSVSAKNEVHNIRGYSPNQWAFGQNSDRTFSYLETYDHLPSMSSDHPTFQENLEKMAKAREIFITVDSARRIFRAAEHKARKNQNYEIGMLVYYYRKGKGRGGKPRGQWYGPARVTMVEKTTDDELGRTGSIVWIVHGTQILRCAPEQLQPVTRDLKGLDMEINGPFLPHDLMKGKKFYHDLFEEQKGMERDMIEGDENAWHQDPNNLRLEHPDQPEIKRRKLQGKQTVSNQELDSVRTDHERAAGSRRGGDHDMQRSTGGKRDRAGGDDVGRAQEVDTTKGQTLREAVREGVDRGHELRQVDSSSLEERRSMEALDRLHREKGEGRESQEAHREEQCQTRQERREQEEAQGNGYGPVRGGVGGRRLGRSLGPWLYRRDELQDQDPDGPNDGDVHPDVPPHGTSRDGHHPGDPAHGEECEVRESRTERSRTPPPSPIVFCLLNQSVMELRWFLMCNLGMSIFKSEVNSDVGLSTQMQNAGRKLFLGI